MTQLQKQLNRGNAPTEYSKAGTSALKTQAQQSSASCLLNFTWAKTPWGSQAATPQPSCQGCCSMLPPPPSPAAFISHNLDGKVCFLNIFSPLLYPACLSFLSYVTKATPDLGHFLLQPTFQLNGLNKIPTFSKEFHSSKRAAKRKKHASGGSWKY